MSAQIFLRWHFFSASNKLEKGVFRCNCVWAFVLVSKAAVCVVFVVFVVVVQKVELKRDEKKWTKRAINKLCVCVTCAVAHKPQAALTSQLFHCSIVCCRLDDSNLDDLVQKWAAAAMKWWWWKHIRKKLGAAIFLNFFFSFVREHTYKKLPFGR